MLAFTRNASILRTAALLALGTAFISGAANFVMKFAVNALKDPIAFTTLKNGLVALALVALVLAISRFREILALTRRQKLLLLAVGTIGGSVPFALYFTGLAMIPAVNAAFIHKTLFIWVALLAIPFLKERVTVLQWAGVVAIFLANLLIGGFKGFAFSTGELLCLIATMLWAVENVVAKIALRDVSALTVGAARMGIGAVLLAVFLFATGRFPDLGALSAAQWGWTSIASLFLLGYVVTWYAALKRAPATFVATLLVPATLVTNVLSALFVTHALSAAQVGAALLFVAGVAATIVAHRRAARIAAEGTCA